MAEKKRIIKSCWMLALILVGVVCADVCYAQEDTDDDGLPFDIGLVLVFVGLIINGGIIYAGLTKAAEIMSKKVEQ